MPRETQSINVGAEVAGLSREAAERIAARAQQYVLDLINDDPDSWAGDAEVIAAGAYVEAGIEDA